MNLVEKNAYVSTLEYDLEIGSKFRVVHADDTIGYYILTYPNERVYELINMFTGQELEFQKGTMFINDVVEELDRLASDEPLKIELRRIKNWAYIPDNRFNLEVDLEGLVI